MGRRRGEGNYSNAANAITSRSIFRIALAKLKGNRSADRVFKVRTRVCVYMCVCVCVRAVRVIPRSCASDERKRGMGWRVEEKSPGENYHRRPSIASERLAALAENTGNTVETRISRTHTPTHRGTHSHSRYRRYTVAERRDALERYRHTNAFICRRTSGFVGHRRARLFSRRRREPAKQKYDAACRR